MLHVALHVSAWIEMYIAYVTLEQKTCRTPCECVDWNSLFCFLCSTFFCRTPCECVDWNINSSCLWCYWRKVALHVSAWIEISSKSTSLLSIKWVALHVSAWIEILAKTYASLLRDVALHVSAWIEICVWTECVVLLRRTPCECVDWNYVLLLAKQLADRRTPCECVDWNCLFSNFRCQRTFVALHVSAWIEIRISLTKLQRNWVALHVSAWIEIRDCSWN